MSLPLPLARAARRGLILTRSLHPLVASVTVGFTGAMDARRGALPHTDAHEAFTAGGMRVADVRPMVADSWLRSSAAGIDPDQQVAPVVLDRSDVIGYRATHALASVFPLLYDVLGRAAVDSDAVMAVGDAEGRLLWVCGAPGVLRAAERINFVEGSAWSESAAGTNAPGVALALDGPAVIRGGEHFSRLVHPWSCAAAPIHDPLTRRILGVVDITGGDDVATPQSLAMIRAAARMAESELARLAATSLLLAPRPEPSGYAAPAPAAVRVSALGLPEAVIEIAGRVQRLSRRHSELLVGLTRRPRGATAEQLEAEVYPEGSRGSTLRVEMSRLRGILGDDLLASRPYRLAAEIFCDWQDVEALLAAGRLREALAAYQGPLLPESEAPGVVEARENLQGSLRRAVLVSDEPDLMAIWTRSRWGADDLALWERLRDTLPPGSPLRPVAEAHVERLYAQLFPQS